jgi:hypothetical protein
MTHIRMKHTNTPAPQKSRASPPPGYDVLGLLAGGVRWLDARFSFYDAAAWDRPQFHYRHGDWLSLQTWEDTWGWVSGGSGGSGVNLWGLGVVPWGCKV